MSRLGISVTPLLLLLLLVILFATVTARPRKVVVKRSDDQVAEAAVVDHLASDVQALKASLAALQNSLASAVADTNSKFEATNRTLDRLDTNVAFLAGFQEGDVGAYHPHMTVKYNQVRVNTGNGYDPVTGLFTAPVSGLYAFGIKIQAQAGRPESLNLIHEGRGFGHIYGDDPNSYDMASTLELLHVNKGERVWVATGSQDNHFQGAMISHFLGFLLHAD